MKRIFALGVLLLALGCAVSSRAEWNGSPAGFGGKLKVAGFTASCTASSNFIARTSGLTNTQKTNYDSLICGMVTDGDWAGVDWIYALAAPSSTIALLSLKSATYNATQSGTVTFAANDGMTGDASTGTLNTGFNPSTAAGNYVQNSASIAACVESSRAANQGWSEVGGGLNTSTYTLLNPYAQFSNDVQYGVNTVFPDTAANTNAQGFWMVSRTAASGAGATTIYKNGSSFGSAATASGSIDNANQTVFSAGGGGFTGDKLSFAMGGLGFNAAAAGRIRTRINTYLTATRGSTGC